MEPTTVVNVAADKSSAMISLEYVNGADNPDMFRFVTVAKPRSPIGCMKVVLVECIDGGVPVNADPNQYGTPGWNTYDIAMDWLVELVVVAWPVLDPTKGTPVGRCVTGLLAHIAILTADPAPPVSVRTLSDTAVSG